MSSRVKRGAIGRKPLVKEGRRQVSFNEWMEGENANRLVTRHELAAFSQFQLDEQIMPMMLRMIQRYDRESRWYRRLWHWLRDMVDRRRNRGVQTASAYLEGLRKERDQDQQPAEPEPEATPIRTCVTCGSAKLARLGARGGLQCENGHVVEDESAEVAP
jgi:hypothetical protein